VPESDDLGAKLRELRQAASMTLAQLSDRVGMSTSNLSKYENGKIVPSVAVVARLADALRVGADVRAALVDQATAAHSELHAYRALLRPSFRRRQEEIRKMEQQATTIRLFQPNLVPGLLQTAEYARHVLAGRSDDELASRVERQAILYDESKTFEFVITEGALRWRLCPVVGHVAQLDRIASLATLANVKVGIVPWSANVGTAPRGNMFCLFDASFVLVETMTAELTLREESDTAFYLRAFATLSKLAEYGNGASVVLDRIASDLRQLGT
jgi:transcriptional regulator with XRE-family HTH domain